jgi:hypothetical protein
MVKALMYHDEELARVVARDGTSPLYLAVSLHHSDIAFELIKQNKEMSYSVPHGQNALHPAVLHSKSKVLVFASYLYYKRAEKLKNTCYSVIPTHPMF